MNADTLIDQRLQEATLTTGNTPEWVMVGDRSDTRKMSNAFIELEFIIQKSKDGRAFKSKDFIEAINDLAAVWKNLVPATEKQG